MSAQPSLLTRSPLFLLYQAAKLLAPLLSPLLWAAILTLALHPLYRKLSSRFRRMPGLAAGIMTFATFLLVIGPAVTLLIILASQSADLYQGASTLLQSERFTELRSRLESSFINKLIAHPALAGVDIKGMIVKGVTEISSGLAGQIGSILKNSVIFLADIAIMLIALFFFFRDGEKYYTTAIELLPFTRKQKNDIAEKFADTFTAVINGVFLIALLQGVMTGLGFFVFGIPFSIFWGFLAALLALLPIGGAALVWVPGALYLYLTGSSLQGVLLAVWGLILVTLPDNVLKPMIIGKKAKIPTFILFIALLGGLQAFGVLGILFGPVVVSLLAVFIQIYREEYADRQ